MLKNNICELIGSTPIVKLKDNLYAKLEYFNPSGSVKDRAAISMIEEYERRGILKSGYTIVEPTSGNTGIAISMIARIKGYKVKIVMPESMSVERRKMMETFGAEFVLTPAKDGMKGAITTANRLVEENENYVILGQFDNKANVDAHFYNTGVEIFNDLNGDIDIFVSGVGTGGTITGCSKYLKSKKEIYTIAVEPKSSAVLSGGDPGVHKIQGIGAGMIPKILDMSFIDEVMTVEDEEAFAKMDELSKLYGIFAGISSGAAYAVASRVADENKNKKVVVVFPDSRDRYLSVK